MSSGLTLRERLAIGLEKRGSQLEAKRTKMWVYSHLTDTNKHYYLGSQGALRVGRTWTSSISLTDSVTYQRLLAMGS